MSRNAVERFVITRGMDNTFTFTIKASGSTSPAVLVPGNDTFSATLTHLGDDGSVISNKALTIVDAANGKVSLTFTSAEVANLETDKGSKTDRYYLRPTYKLVIDCSTQNEGDFIAKVPEVYID